jgi:hypothetical protein
VQSADANSPAAAEPAERTTADKSAGLYPQPDRFAMY